jgi:hypothetical protein
MDLVAPGVVLRLEENRGRGPVDQAQGLRECKPPGQRWKNRATPQADVILENRLRDPGRVPAAAA